MSALVLCFRVPFRLLLATLSIVWLTATAGRAQSAPKGTVDIVLGPASLPIDKYYTISIQLREAALERYSPFPELEGFKKSGKSSTTTTRIVAGQTYTELTITQRYAAYEEGEYLVRPFTMTVNGQLARSAGATLTVGPQAEASAGADKDQAAEDELQGLGSLDRLFGKPRPQDYVEPRDNAFLALVVDKPTVFVGEGVHVGLYFYLTPEDQGLLDFHDFAGQLPGILRQVRQRTAWEEPFNDQEILPETVTIKSKPYLRYRLYEAEYYPLNGQALEFPAVSLQMVKYRLAKNPAEGLDNRLEGYKTYYSRASTVRVRPLPPHPLRDQVPVGNYRLREAIDRTAFRTGQAFSYTFTVEGEGNLAALNAPVVAGRPHLDIYGPDVQQELTRQSERVGGRKRFRYRLVAQRPGPVQLDSMVSLIIFNPATARYDTLRPEVRPEVRGAARLATALRIRPDDAFYAAAFAAADATVQPLDAYGAVRRYANLVLLALLSLAVVGWWQSRKRSDG